MKPLDFRKVCLHEAFRVRLEEIANLIQAIDTETDDLVAEFKRPNNDLNWVDFGLLTHAVEQLEEAAFALGIEVPVDPSSK